MNRPRAQAKALALAAAAAGWRPAVSGRWGAAFGRLVAEEVEHGLLPLLIPLAFAAGIGAYFAVPDEPWPVAPLVLALGCAALALAGRRRFRLLVMCGLLASFFGGFAWPALKASLLPKPLPLGRMQVMEVSGFVESVEVRGGGVRLVLLLVGGPQEGARLRITAQHGAAPVVGDAVRLKARVGPTAGPAFPGGYDFARDAFFQGIVGSGFALGRLEPADLGARPLRLWAARQVFSMRQAVSARIRAHIDGENGRIADALVTGKRDGISNETNDILRAAGVFHILSVSGFHMALVSLMIFAVVRGLLALVPAVALRWPTKPLAAAVALLAAAFYLLLSGAEVATQRSFIMIAVVLAGTMLGREALSLRTLGVAVMGVLGLAPESLLSPSFQMSFAATLALVSGLRFARPLIERTPESRAGLRQTLVFLTQGVSGLAMSSFLAGLATMPYSAFHFQNLQLYGVLGNLLGAPIIEFITMPLEIAALVLWPLGLDGPLWRFCGLSIDWFMAASRFVGGLEGGILTVKAFPVAAVLLMSLGLLLVGLLKTRLRILGLVPAALGLAVAMAAPVPLGFIDRQGESALLAGDRPVAIGAKPNRFALSQWLSALGHGAAYPVASGVCDFEGCTGQGAGLRLSLSSSWTGLHEDCERADIVVSPHPPPKGCKALFIPAATLMAQGGMAVHRGEGGLSLTPVRILHAKRIWHAAPPVRMAPEASGADEP